MTWSLSAEPTSPSLLLALNPEPKATPGAEPSEVAVTPSLPTTGTPSAIYLPFPQVLRFRTGGTLMAQPTPTTDEGPIITLGFTRFAAAPRNLCGRSGSTWSGSTKKIVFALKKLLFHSTAAPEMQVHFLLLTCSAELRHPENTEKVKHEETLLSLNPHMSKDNSVPVPS